MTYAMSRRLCRSGFTLIELAVVICIFGVLSSVLLNRVLSYQEQAEKAAMEQTVGIVRSALQLKVADLIAKGRLHEIVHLVDQNPMELLAQKPKNYVGEYFALKPQEVTSGYWYFDLQNGNLIYSVRNSANFRAAKDEENRVRFQVKLVSNTHSAETNSDIQGVILDQVVPYTWF
jgi:prepilin-type N-terminal cleavage/methylation domain-containing protein